MSLSTVSKDDEKLLFRTSYASLEDQKYLPPYLRDTPETTVPAACPIRGAFPAWLNGNFVRTGGGKWTIPLSEDQSRPPAVMQHWFDGLGIIHKFNLSDGKVTYSSRHTADGIVRRALRDGYLASTIYGPDANTAAMAEDPCSALYKQHQSEFTPFDISQLEPDAAHVNVVVRRGLPLPKNTGSLLKGTMSDRPEVDELWLSTDFNILQIVDSETLEPKRLLTYANISPDLKGYGICAHALKDRYVGHMYNYVISEDGVMSVFALDYVNSPVSMLWKTPLPCKPAYVHSLAMTRKYVVFIRQPLALDANGATTHVLDLLEYEHDKSTFFYVLDKTTGKLVAQYECSPFLFFHSVNAYDYRTKAGETNIHVDLCSYKEKHPMLAEFRASNILDPAKPFSNATLVRYELPGVGSASPTEIKRATVAQSIHGVSVELARINKTSSMKPGYRYVWGTSDKGGPAPGSQIPIGRLGNGVKTIQAALIEGIVKTDWESGKSIKWLPPDGDSCPCEPVFVPRPGALEEDDGVVLTITCSKTGSHSILVALDGRTLAEIARADMPQVYGIGAHGTFIEDVSMYTDKTHYA